MNIEKAAEIIGITKEEILRLIEEGKIKARRRGSGWSISKKAISEFLEGQIEGRVFDRSLSEEEVRDLYRKQETGDGRQEAGNGKWESSGDRAADCGRWTADEKRGEAERKEVQIPSWEETLREIIEREKEFARREDEETVYLLTAAGQRYRIHKRTGEVERY